MELITGSAFTGATSKEREMGEVIERVSAEGEARRAKLREIKPYCNHIGYSDIEPYEVVRVVSDKCVEVRRMKCEELPWEREFYPGGFFGHTANQREQKWEITPDEEAATFKVRWSEANETWQRGKHIAFRMADEPRKFYDYNF